MKITHRADIIVDDYQFADTLNNEVRVLLDKGCMAIGRDRSNVKASVHTEWNWEPNNITFKNLKSYIINKIENKFAPGKLVSGVRWGVKFNDFWANVYEKGDYALSHCHIPYDYSFVYFVKTKWYYSPLVFSDSGKKVRPKEGRLVIFPSYLMHHVPVHRYNDYRITLSGNMATQINWRRE